MFNQNQLTRIEAICTSALWRLDALARQVSEMHATLSRVAQMENIIMSQQDDFEAELGNNTSVVGSVQTLIAKFIADAQAAHDAGDPARMQAVLDKWKANDATLAGLVAANTVAETPATPPAQPTP